MNRLGAVYGHSPREGGGAAIDLGVDEISEPSHSLAYQKPGCAYVKDI